MVSVGAILTSVVVSILTALMGCVAAYFRKKVKSIGNRLNAQDKATVAMLRMDLRQVAKQFLRDGCTDYDSLEDWHDMYEQYKALGGNGTMDTLKGKIEALPIKGD